MELKRKTVFCFLEVQTCADFMLGVVRIVLLYAPFAVVAQALIRIVEDLHSSCTQAGLQADRASIDAWHDSGGRASRRKRFQWHLFSLVVSGFLTKHG